ncbi:Oxygen oxidoreductase covalent FAD-binding site [Lasiodiplodia theobromae]|uniref:Oxygen oxidoreductase covalent FAD-binding site n=1 Tax=Lasiodiplodia theobromae TaxID=45133 RepID=UPI0015C302FB|nr:Oxygen oxidoreductase covalent FAD-binding site [Lasiodiplodia theobromae]KAF4543435.1 Oxygen oxidoreductase covalent FAD-binding site [Lasiodiplodia theobromae]
MGQQASSAAAATPDLKSCLTTAVGGDANVAFPSDLLYQITDVKPYNLDIPVTPAAVTYPDSAEQVAGIIACAAQYDHKVQARSGGHSYGNYCLGGKGSSAIVIDMKKFQQFSMDEDTWVATIGAGTLLEDVTDRLHNAGGRTIAHGTSPQIGIGGHATIGGLGPQSRELGTAADQVIGCEVVLANASIIYASPTSYPDVFFAMRGAGASFGVVTQLDFRTAPEPGEMVLYEYNITLGDAATLATAFKAWNNLVSEPELSWKFTSVLTVFEGGMSISGTFFGGRPEFDRLNLEGVLPGVADLKVSVTNSFVGAVGEWANDLLLKIGGGIPAAFYSKSLSFSPTTTLTDEAIDAMFEYFDKADKGGALAWFVIFNLVGGQINAIPMDDAAYSLRDSLYQLQSYAISLLPPVSQKTKDFLNGVNELIEGYVPGVRGAYPGYVDPDLPDGQEQYWGANLPRLERIKAEVDPTDLFHNPQSVRPAEA